MKRVIIWSILVLFCFPYTYCRSEMKNEGSPEDQATTRIRIYPNRVEKTLSTYMSGFNMSYYHDKDVLWADGKLATKLREVKVGVLRYPGGAETAYFHWRYTGCPGYRDLWNEEHDIDKNEISSITENMDTDEFIKLCREIGSEPMIGINIQSGVVNNRLDESLQEAIDWVKYCKEKGYRVKYWYLDGEVDHWGSYTQITVEQYADIINRFSKPLKAVDPDIKLIVNLIGGTTLEKQKRLINLAGKSFDIIDFHYYYGWDIAEWAKWTTQCPMINTDTGMTYTDEINSLTSYIKGSVNPDIKMVALEWNIGPTKVDVLSNYKQALMQTEMYQELLRSDLQMACIWPLIWKVKENTFPSLFNQENYSLTPLFQIMKLYNVMLGNSQVHSVCADAKIVVHSAKDHRNAWICAINKHNSEHQVTIESIGKEKYKRAVVHTVYSDVLDSDNCSVSVKKLRMNGGAVTFTIPAYSFFRVELE